MSIISSTSGELAQAKMLEKGQCPQLILAELSLKTLVKYGK